MNTRLKLLSLCCALLAACGGEMNQEETSSLATRQDAVKVSAESSTGANDNGTRLSATGEVTGNTCVSTEAADVSIAGVLTTTGSVDSALITVSVNGGEATQVGVINPQDFSRGGRVKTAPYALTLNLPNGEHAISVCFTQSGAQGREPKAVCAETLVVVVDCAPDEEPNVCADAEPFGNIVGNPNLCRGNGPPHIPVHVRGDFGEEPSLSISGPNGFAFATSMRHAGESCNYHYNWDTDGNNGGAGTYTFTVTGNGQTLTFTADLKCSSRNLDGEEVSF